MFGKKIFFLAAGYIAGNIVSTLYNSKSKKAQKMQSREDAKMMLDNFLQTQKNLLWDLENKFLSDENKDTFTQKKKEFWELSKKYIEMWEKFLSEISKNQQVQSAQEKGKDAVRKWIKKWKKLLADLQDNTGKK